MAKKDKKGKGPGGQPEPSEQPPPPGLQGVPGPGTAARVIIAVSEIFRLLFWLAMAYVVLSGIRSVLEVVAGTDTAFDFNFSASTSLSISVVSSGAAAGLYLRNRQLTRRLRECEGRHRPSSPQAERLPLPGDGGPQ